MDKDLLAQNLLEYFERELIDWGAKKLAEVLNEPRGTDYKTERLEILEQLTGKTKDILDSWEREANETRESDEYEYKYAKGNQAQAV
jgi:hypothetical protein